MSRSTGRRSGRQAQGDELRAHGEACSGARGRGRAVAERSRAQDAEEDRAFGRDKGEELPKWVADKKSAPRRSGRRRPNWRPSSESGRGGQGQSAGRGRGRRQAEAAKPGKPAAPPSEEPDPKAQRTTDPDKPHHENKDGFIQLNAQAAVDATAQVIVAHGLDAKQSDQHQLAPIADAIEANLGRSRRNCRRTRAIAPTPTLRRWRNRDRRLYRAGAGQARGGRRRRRRPRRRHARKSRPAGAPAPTA